MRVLEQHGCRQWSQGGNLVGFKVLRNERIGCREVKIRVGLKILKCLMNAQKETNVVVQDRVGGGERDRERERERER